MKRGEKDFKPLVKEKLEKEGYRVVFDVKINKRRPDIVAIKGEEALIVEVKSEREATNTRCLETFEKDDAETRKVRERAREELEKEVGIWYVYIHQALGYFKIGREGRWESKEVGLSEGKYQLKPALAFPTNYRTWVEKALGEWKKNPIGGYKVKDWQFLSLDSEVNVVIIDCECES